MEVIYIISQLFVIIEYIFIISTYQVKTKKQIIIFNTLAAISAIISFLCLGAYAGCMMSIVSILRNYLFSKRNENDTSKLSIILLILFIFTIFTYNGLLSLMPTFATLLYTLSVWQNNTKTYKKYGILVSIFWIIYHIYVKSLFGIILEGMSLLSAIIGLIREKK